MARNVKSVKNILKRPLFKLIFLILIVILGVVVIKNCFKGKKEEPKKLIGYQRLVNTTAEGEYKFVNLDGDVKTYSGYKSMSDFYYDVTNVSREGENSVIEYALINKNKKEVIKFGTYDNIVQVIGGKYYKVLKDGKFGIVDTKGKVILKPQYEYISATTVQDGTEIVFECQNGEHYDIMNESGKIFSSIEKSVHSISYINKLNSDYDTIVKITIDGNAKYYNLATGEELFAGVTDVNMSYNILKEENKLTIFDKNYKKNKVIDTSSDYSAEARAYFNRYVLVEQKNVNSGNREVKYTVYDENLKIVVESENKINIVKSAAGDVYFLVNDEDCVKIINENKKTKKVKGYEFNSNSVSDLQAIVLNPIGDTSSYALFNFKGKKIDENVSAYNYKGASLTIAKGGEESYLLFSNGDKYQLTGEEGISATEHYLTVEDVRNGTVSLISKEGKVVLDKVAGTKIFYNEKYIGLQSDKTINIYSTTTGKMTYTYTLDSYVDRDETVNYVELTDGYYTFEGKKIIEKVQ